MYDETIQRSAHKLEISPIEFQHPYQEIIVNSFIQNHESPFSIILTGTAGDGKTHLCRQVWNKLKGSEADWASNNPYLYIDNYYPYAKIHFIRDLSGWAPQQGIDWEKDKEELLHKFCYSLFSSDVEDIFLIAANDGQLIECFRRLKENEYVKRARLVFEDLLVEDRQEEPGVRLKFFNLSRTNSAELFERAIVSFLEHPGWNDLKNGTYGENEVFGSNCPIRHNYELLQGSIVRTRLRSLFELCDYNDLHIPIRQILLLLANAILGHPDVKDHLMVAADVPKIISAGTCSKASLYNNIFGGNLSENRRQAITIFDYFEHFQIGYETSNRIDNILIFGENDKQFGQYFNDFVAKDTFYGADPLFYAAKQEYIEGTNEDEDKSQDFLQMLISQRRGLFFKIPENAEQELNLWELTVFKFAGEYLNSVVKELKNNGVVKRAILSRLIKGLNRVFTGMLINGEQELFLASSGNYSQAKVSRILIERVSVEPSKGERIILRYDANNKQVLLSVFFTSDLYVDFNLSLIRYEFLSRIALDGALPASFSKECYEDLLAFKSNLIGVFLQRQAKECTAFSNNICLKLLTLTEQGTPEIKFVEILP
jgi:hypothetical protein